MPPFVQYLSLAVSEEKKDVFLNLLPNNDLPP